MSLPKAIENIRSKIVQISFFASRFSPELEKSIKKPFITQVLGTGFFVSSEAYVITARHVIMHAREIFGRMQADEKRISVGLALPNVENMRGNFSMVEFEVVDEDTRHDLVLLKLMRNPFKGEVGSGFVVGDKKIPLLYGVPTFNARRPVDGEAIGISGYPLNEPVLITNSGHIASSWAIEVTEVSVSGAPEWFQMPDIADVYLGDIEVNPGDSGAPAYLVEDSTIIGMCVAIKKVQIQDEFGTAVKVDGKPISYSSGLTLIVPARYILSLLEKNSVKYEV